MAAGEGPAGSAELAAGVADGQTVAAGSGASQGGAPGRRGPSGGIVVLAVSGGAARR